MFKHNSLIPQWAGQDVHTCRLLYTCTINLLCNYRTSRANLILRLHDTGYTLPNGCAFSDMHALRACTSCMKVRVKFSVSAKQDIKEHDTNIIHYK